MVTSFKALLVDAISFIEPNSFVADWATFFESSYKELAIPAALSHLIF
ncbi:hypothetical protein LL033_05465 [Clostridium estertheticum]|nr:hypothetical protein [Clostridium estertheticum]WAG56689.1 hypothetical protein LL033_05465 [Clostridium estertheticum]